MSSVAVVIPIYKEKLNELEKISLAQCRKVLKNYPIIFVAPEGKNFSYIAPNEFLVQFPPQYFQSVKAYSRLLMSPIFYEPFLSFDYMLIYQLDAFVFYDALEEFCRLDYDYIGAAWPYYAWHGLRLEKTPRVGNGGFCLRKVSACHNLLTELKQLSNWEKITDDAIEDGVFATCGISDETNFSVAPVEVTKLFSMEWYPDRHIKRLGNKLPFGCHAWTKFHADFYVELFAQLGYDLRPLRARMRNDNELLLPQYLEGVAMKRLELRIEHEVSLLKYLSTRRFASIRVIKSPDAMKILARLLTEENSLTDKIFIYNEKDFRNLICDVSKEDLPHLVLCMDYDESLIAAIEQKGLIYGEHVISFRQEYLKVQEKLFHNLGR